MFNLISLFFKGGKGKDFKVSDMDEWENDDDDFGSESDKVKII